jgi:anti-sigma factor RsiW
MTTDHTLPVTEAQLHAVVDGQLPADEVEAVSQWLRTHPEDAARVAAWHAQRAQLQALQRDVLDEPVPVALVDTLGGPRRMRWPQYAAAAALFAVGCSGGWFARSAIPEPPAASVALPGFVREAKMAYLVYTPEKRHPVEVSADQSKHLIEWLSRRLGAPLAAPDLSAQGYSLMGGRLLPGEQGQSRAQFMYEQPTGERITLHVSVFGPGTAPAPTSFRFASDTGSSSFYWVDGRYGYALTGTLARPALEKLANVAYTQLIALPASGARQ